MFLDCSAGSSQSVQTQLLQISHLTGSEKDLCPTKLVLIGVLEIEPLRPKLETNMQCTTTNNVEQKAIEEAADLN